MTSPQPFLTKEDFDRARWEAVITGSDRRDCTAYMALFAAKVKEADASGDDKTQEVFALLRAITSLHLRSESKDEPFGPMWVLNNS